MPGPVLRAYKGGSIVYFEKDRSEDIYVLQSGKVVLTFTSIDSKHEIKEDVRIGEFFGVKSSLGRYPREETAQVVQHATLLVFKPNEFEKFVSNKTHLIIKMLKVFSGQLRSIHRQVRELLGQGDAKMPAYELMNVAEVYYKTGNFDYAIYGFSRYLALYPSGKYAGRATELLNVARKKQPFPINMPDLVYEPDPQSDKLAMDFFLNKAEESKESTEDHSITGIYNKAHLYFNAGKLMDALDLFKSLIQRNDIKEPGEQKFIDNAIFQSGKCSFSLGNKEHASQFFSAYLKKSPKGEYMKEALFNLAKISDDQGEMSKAAMLYEKVSLLPPGDDLSAKAKKRSDELKA